MVLVFVSLKGPNQDLSTVIIRKWLNLHRYHSFMCCRM